ncbi:MAG: hypothetical protein ABSE73_04720 [Planctomycetota bacterium]
MGRETRITEIKVMLIVAFLAMLFPFVYVAVKRNLAKPTNGNGPSQVVKGVKTLHFGDEFSFATGETCSAGNIAFKELYSEPYILGNGCTFAELGPVELQNVAEAPESGYGHRGAFTEGCDRVKVVVGNTYAVAIGEFQAFAILRATDMKRDGNGASLTFEYAFQKNGSRVFQPKAGQLSPIETARAAMERRLSTEIPAFRKVLNAQLLPVKNNLAAASSTVQAQGTKEMEEIARTMLALDQHEQDCRNSLKDLEAAERQIERSTYEDFLKTASQQELQQVSKAKAEAEIRLGIALDKQLQTGQIQRASVDAKIKELSEPAPK